MIVGSHRMLTDDDRNLIVKRFANETISEIAVNLGLNKSTIEQVLRESLWGLAKLNEKLLEQVQDARLAVMYAPDPKPLNGLGTED